MTTFSEVPFCGCSLFVCCLCECSVPAAVSYSDCDGAPLRGSADALCHMQSDMGERICFHGTEDIARCERLTACDCSRYCYFMTFPITCTTISTAPLCTRFEFSKTNVFTLSCCLHCPTRCRRIHKVQRVSVPLSFWPSQASDERTNIKTNCYKQLKVKTFVFENSKRVQRGAVLMM